MVISAVGESNMTTFKVILEPQEEGGYTVTVPNLPGCISEGETVEEAIENIKDAIRGYLVVYSRKLQREYPNAKIIDIAI